MHEFAPDARDLALVMDDLAVSSVRLWRMGPIAGFDTSAISLVPR
jgi:hypothetical protein